MCLNVCFFSCTPPSNLLFCMCAYIKLMFLFARVCLQQNGCLFSFASKFKCLLFLLCVFIKMLFCSCLPTLEWLLLTLCAYIFMFAFSRVYLYQKLCFFSPVCLHQMFANSRLHLNQNGCFYSCAPASKWLPILVCIYIKMFAFTHVRLHQNGCQFSFPSKSMFAFTRVHLHQNGCQFSFASKQKCFLLHVCACIKMVANTRVHLHQNGCFYSCAPTSKWLPILVCM